MLRRLKNDSLVVRSDLSIQRSDKESGHRQLLRKYLDLIWIERVKRNFMYREMEDVS